MTETPTALDATFLELEEADESAHMHIGGVLVFEPADERSAPTLNQLRANVADRLPLLPRYRQRLSRPRTGGLQWPQWEKDPRFDVRAHLRHAVLPAPGDDSELLDWAADFFSHRLDRTRPLWEMVLVEGLADDRWALCWKTHHSLVDGVGSVELAHVLLDTEPDPARHPATNGTTAPNHRHEAATPAVLGRKLMHGALHPRRVLARTAALIDLLIRDEVVAAPRTSLNVPMSGGRLLATVSIPLAEIKEIKDMLGGTVNDVVLAAATAGLRRLLLARGENPPSQGLRAMVPVNVRADDEHGDLGNRIASLFVELPVAEPDLPACHAQIVDATHNLKQSSQQLGAGTLLGLTELAPPILHSMLARALFAARLFNVTITNVPGPQTRLYLAGAPLREVIPLVPLAAEHAVGIAVVSYDGNVFFGLNADRAGVPDLGVLAEGISDAITELRGSVGSTVDGP